MGYSHTAINDGKQTKHRHKYGFKLPLIGKHTQWQSKQIIYEIVKNVNTNYLCIIQPGLFCFEQ